MLSPHRTLLLLKNVPKPDWRDVHFLHQFWRRFSRLPGADFPDADGKATLWCEKRDTCFYTLHSFYQHRFNHVKPRDLLRFQLHPKKLVSPVTVAVWTLYWDGVLQRSPFSRLWIFTLIILSFSFQFLKAREDYEKLLSDILSVTCQLSL